MNGLDCIKIILEDKIEKERENTLIQSWVFLGKLGRFHLWIGVGTCLTIKTTQFWVTELTRTKPKNENLLNSRLKTKERELWGGAYMSEGEDVRGNRGEMGGPGRRSIGLLRQKIEAQLLGCLHFTHCFPRFCW